MHIIPITKMIRMINKEKDHWKYTDVFLFIFLLEKFDFLLS